MTGRKAKGDHVFLAVAPFLPELLYALAEIREKLPDVWHPSLLPGHEQKYHVQKYHEQISVDYVIIETHESSSE